jgi:hypothetical protein
MAPFLLVSRHSLTTRSFFAHRQTEPDGFWGWNNIFSIPEQPVEAEEEDAAHAPPDDFDEDTEVESIAAVESIADTASEAGADDARSNGEPELIDLDDVISDPDYPGMPGSFTLTGEQKAAISGDYAAAEERSLSNLSVLAKITLSLWNCVDFLLYSYLLLFEESDANFFQTAFLDSRSSASSLPEWCGFGLRSRY